MNRLLADLGVPGLPGIERELLERSGEAKGEGVVEVSVFEVTEEEEEEDEEDLVLSNDTREEEVVVLVGTSCCGIPVDGLVILLFVIAWEGTEVEDISVGGVDIGIG